MRLPLTQKARGVLAMNLYGPWESMVPPLQLVQTEKQAAGVELWGESKYGRFCPPRPEHGYIDSVPVKDTNHLLEMLKQTKGMHKDSEIMLMPYYMPESLMGSFVWTPSSVTVGAGNDGATAGKKGCVRIPIVPTQLPKDVLEAAGVPEDQTPYIEGLVENGGAIHLVQLRYGPEPPAAMDFVPEEMKVEQVIVAEGDLIEFGEKVKNLPKGSVVDHFGGSLTSHYGVHCLTNKVPVVTTFKPEVGMRLKVVEQKLAAHDPKAVGDWFLFSMRDARSRYWSLADMKHACNAALWILHNAAAMGEHPEIVGAGLAILVKLCTIACHGEARHLAGDPEHGNGRTNVFKGRLRNALKAIADLERKREMFEGMGTAPTGVGGQAWAHCCSVTIELIEDLRALVAEPSHDALVEVLTQANIVVNEAHNGGWWLNKFTYEEVFDACSTGEPHSVGLALPGLLGVKATMENTSAKVWGRVVGFRRKSFLELPQREKRPPILRGTQIKFYVHTATKRLYVSGNRLGWWIPAPQEMLADVESGVVLPVFYRNQSQHDPIVEGSPVSIVSEIKVGNVQAPETREYDFIFTGATMFDARCEVEMVSEREVLGLCSHTLRSYGFGSALVLCNKCFKAMHLLTPKEGEMECAECSGKPLGKALCKCGKAATVISVEGIGSTPICWDCAFKVSSKERRETLKAREDQKAEAWKIRISPRIMCSNPKCSATYRINSLVSAAKKSWHCGCSFDSSHNSVSLTLEVLKGLNKLEQEK